MIDPADSVLIVIDVQDPFLDKLAPDAPAARRSPALADRHRPLARHPDRRDRRGHPRARRRHARSRGPPPAGHHIHNKLIFGLAADPAILAAVERPDAAPPSSSASKPTSASPTPRSASPNAASVSLSSPTPLAPPAPRTLPDSTASATPGSHSSAPRASTTNGSVRRTRQPLPRRMHRRARHPRQLVTA